MITRRSAEEYSTPDLIPIEEASELCGVDVKRLRGRIFRNSVRHNDPIGSLEIGLVYRWSLPKRADATSAATPQRSVAL